MSECGLGGVCPQPAHGQTIAQVTLGSINDCESDGLRRDHCGTVRCRHVLSAYGVAATNALLRDVEADS